MVRNPRPLGQRKFKLCNLQPSECVRRKPEVLCSVDTHFNKNCALSNSVSEKGQRNTCLAPRE
eukprot:3129866-Amphidinium_carterae.1